MKTGGKVIVEDFGYDLMDESTALWYQGLKNTMAPLVGKPDWALALDDAREHWIKHHSGDHQLHKAADMVHEMNKRFSKVQVIADQPYLFRYFIGPDGMRSETVDAIFSWETQMISAGRIKGIGLRIVGG